MAVNKVIYNEETLIDLTEDTVSESSLLSGVSAHSANGEAIVGTLAPVQETAIAETYSTSDTYAAGDYVMQDGLLYRCITAITTAEDWTAEHWEGVQVVTLTPTAITNDEIDGLFP